MSSYIDIHKAQQESDEKMHRFVFLHISRVAGNKNVSIELIHDHLTFSHDALVKAIRYYKRFCTLTVKEGVLKGQSKPDELFFKLNDDGIQFFMNNVVISH